MLVDVDVLDILFCIGGESCLTGNKLFVELFRFCLSDGVVVELAYDGFTWLGETIMSPCRFCFDPKLDMLALRLIEVVLESRSLRFTLLFGLGGFRLGERS